MFPTATDQEQFEVLVIIPGREAQSRTVRPGTTVAQLAGELGIPGAENMSALDGMSNSIGPRDQITRETEVVNYIYKLAGA